MERFGLLLLAGLAIAPAASQTTARVETAAYVGTPAIENGLATPEVRRASQPHERRDLDQADDGLFYVEALVNGAPIRFVVDTGASVVVLTEDDAAAIGYTPGGKSALRVQTAGGTTDMRRIKLREVTLAGKTVTGVDAAVVPGHLKVSLLGQNVLSQLDSVTMTGRKLRLN